MGRLDSITNPGGHLRTTVVNGARRRLANRRLFQPLDERAGPPRTGGSPPLEYLVDLLDELPERERTALVLRYHASDEWPVGGD